MRSGPIIVVAGALMLVIGLVAGVRSTASIGTPGATRDVLDGAKPGRLVRLPDGRRIDLRCEGAGSPTVLLEGGYAANATAWGKIEPAVARTTRVCAYDRAGAGFSDPGPLPRDGAAIARDLDQALRAAGVAGPFVLVGHSAGGLYVRLFAGRRPADVVGMVLVETSIEHQDQRFAAIFGPGAGSLTRIRGHAAACLAAAERGALPSAAPDLASCTPAAKPGQSPALAAENLAENARASTWRTRVSELDNLFTTTSDELDRGRRSYGDMPLVVLTAADAYAGAPAEVRESLAAAWAGFHRQIAAMSSRGSAQLVAGATHMMILDRPQAVVAAIEEVVGAARRAKGHAPLLEAQVRRSRPAPR
ncbi:MAG: alpha/beta fold hydrolase [Caulobacteraceae bacterium]